MARYNNNEIDIVYLHVRLVLQSTFPIMKYRCSHFCSIHPVLQYNMIYVYVYVRCMLRGCMYTPTRYKRNIFPDIQYTLISYRANEAFLWNLQDIYMEKCTSNISVLTFFNVAPIISDTVTLHRI
jgi:hypothetical protein